MQRAFRADLRDAQVCKAIMVRHRIKQVRTMRAALKRLDPSIGIRKRTTKPRHTPRVAGMRKVWVDELLKLPEDHQLLWLKQVAFYDQVTIEARELFEDDGYCIESSESSFAGRYNEEDRLTDKSAKAVFKMANMVGAGIEGISMQYETGTSELETAYQVSSDDV